jgi:CheY-like chemotaxis protein
VIRSTFDLLAHVVVTALAPGRVIVGAMRDGQAALAAARDLSPDVVVLEISMPG